MSEMVEEPLIKQRKKTIPRTAFKKGKPGGPGRPKGSRDFTSELIIAMRKVEKKHSISMLTHAWERALENDKVLVSMLKKIVPDLTHETGQRTPSVINIVNNYRQAPKESNAARF